MGLPVVRCGPWTRALGARHFDPDLVVLGVERSGTSDEWHAGVRGTEFVDPEGKRRPARGLLRPPIRRGDLIAVLKERPAIVGIIDGQFLHNLAVSPREIFAASRRDTVLGAASMGALRAVEMSPYGMIGVGTIFRWFRDVRLVAEDQLAVAYDPDTGAALSDALVNMRHAYSRAVAETVIHGDTRRVLIRLAWSLYFPERATRQRWNSPIEGATGRAEMIAPLVAAPVPGPQGVGRRPVAAGGEPIAKH